MLVFQISKVQETFRYMKLYVSKIDTGTNILLTVRLVYIVYLNATEMKQVFFSYRLHVSGSGE